MNSIIAQNVTGRESSEDGVKLTVHRASSYTWTEVITASRTEGGICVRIGHSDLARGSAITLSPSEAGHLAALLISLMNAEPPEPAAKRNAA